MTLNGNFALCFKIHAFSEPSTKISLKIDPYYQQQRYCAMTVVSGNIRFMRIFAGVHWTWGVKRQWDNRKRRISRPVDATSSASKEIRPTLLYSIILSLVAFPLTPKYMTLNGHCTLIFTVTNNTFTNLFYMLTVEPIKRIFLFYHVTSRDVRKGTVIRRIFVIRGRTADLS